MARMTEEEAWALSDYVLNNEISFGTNGSGWLTQREKHPWGLENMTVNYLLNKANSLQKSPAQIIDELVSKEIASAASA